MSDDGEIDVESDEISEMNDGNRNSKVGYTNYHFMGGAFILKYRLQNKNCNILCIERVLNNIHNFAVTNGGFIYS